jgi:N-acetylneuraminic acid mutarotase
MADQPGTLEHLAAALARALEPLAFKLSDEAALDTFARLGVNFPPQLLTEPNITPARATLTGAANALGPARDALRQAIASGNAPAMIAADTTLLAGAAAVFAAAAELAQQIKQHGPALPGVDPASVNDLAAGLPRKLFDQVIVDAVDETTRGLAAWLAITGLVERVHHPGDAADPTKPDFEAVSVHFDRLAELFTSPVDYFRSLVTWGDPAFDGVALLNLLYEALILIGFPVFLEPGGGATRPKLSGLLFELVPAPPGLDLSASVALDGQLDEDHPIIAPGWSLGVTVAWSSAAGVAVRLRPPLAITVVPNGTFTGTVQIALTDAATAPTVVLGQAGGSRLEFAKLELDGGVELAVDAVTGEATAVPAASGELTGGKLVIDLSGADGFIGTLLGGGRLESDFGVGFSFTPDGGLRFHGSAGLEVQVPVHIKIGPVELESIYLLASLAGGKVPVELSAAFTAQLGPIKASVERLGATATFGFPDGGGNLGPLDLAFGFKPPNGVGLAVDAGVVAGGGFLYIDQDRGEYAGALELEFAGFLQIKAIGLITTRMPDGSPGFSLLIVMTAEFGGGGIQLGYGFTLLAVGGLLGLNRRMNLQALVDGVRSGAVQSVMFPKDVVANAPRILSDLRTFFPPQNGTFLVGPMAKIGWGTPTLVSVSLGVIIEIPGDLAIIGVLKAALPTEELPLLVLQVNFIGAVEFDKQRLWFFAQLFDSRVLTMTIDGGMGLLVGWGEDADLVLSVGGFHPSYKPPALPFPVPDRLSVTILNQPGALIRVSGYFAITSNTVQFGAKAELRLGFSDFGIEGHLAFDALFQFSPFRFVIAISAGVSLKAFGVGLFSIHLDFQLEGPAPWRAHGRGSISILFFEISADFDITWGDDRNPTLPPVSVLELLATEITKVEGWETRPPAGGAKPLVNLRTLPETDKLVLHPLGTLFIRQKALPLNVRIDRVGAQRPSDGKRLSVAPAPGSGLVRVSITADKFAMAQYQDMDDATKLSRPAYETQDAGIELTAAEGLVQSPRVVRRSTRYELHIFDSGAGGAAQAITMTAPGTARMSRVTRSVARRAAANGGGSPTRRSRFYNVSPAVYGRLLGGSSTARSPLSRREALLRQPFAPEDTIQVTGPRYVVAYVRTNRQAFPPGTDAATATYRGQAAAEDALADWVATDHSLAGQLHVIPESEVVAPLATPETWSAAGALPVAAAGAGAAVLGDGRVLVAGGSDGAGRAVAAAAVFDPVTGTWTATPPPTTARREHAVTKLDDGRVLVTGGIGADGAVLAAAEIYDPVTSTWSATDPMAAARHGHSATLLTGGRVLVAGGAGQGSTLPSAEVYDPAARPAARWKAAAPMTDARSGHRAVTLSDHRVLVIGGALATGGRDVPLAYCEVYDPGAGATGTWTPTGSLGTPRAGHEATVLAGGAVLATGGDPTGLPVAGAVRATALDTAERYDPAAGTWTPVRSMPGGGRGRHRGVLLRSGRVLVTGGTGGTGSGAGFRAAVIYDPAADAWTATGEQATGRAGFVAVALGDGRVLAAGGVVAAGAAAPGPDPAVVTATTEIFTP